MHIDEAELLMVLEVTGDEPNVITGKIGLNRIYNQ